MGSRGLTGCLAGSRQVHLSAPVQARQTRVHNLDPAKIIENEKQGIFRTLDIGIPKPFRKWEERGPRRSVQAAPARLKTLSSHFSSLMFPLKMQGDGDEAGPRLGLSLARNTDLSSCNSSAASSTRVCSVEVSNHAWKVCQRRAHESTQLSALDSARHQKALQRNQKVLHGMAKR